MGHTQFSWLYLEIYKKKKHFYFNLLFEYLKFKYIVLKSFCFRVLNFTVSYGYCYVVLCFSVMIVA